MIELGQLEGRWKEFETKNVKVTVVSIEGMEDAKATQADYPHLQVVSDKDRSLTEAVQVLHRESAPDGGDTAAPTTLLLGGDGVARWVYRPGNVFRRLSPDELLSAIDDHP